MNIKVNKILSEMPEVKEFFVAASGGDESLPIGGCYYEMSKKFNPKMLHNIYLGPEFSNNEVEKILLKYKKNINFKKTNIKELAKLLNKGNTVA